MSKQLHVFAKKEHIEQKHDPMSQLEIQSLSTGMHLLFQHQQSIG